MKKHLLAALLFAVPALLGAVPAGAVPAPRPALTSLQLLPLVTMAPFDEKANADAEVAAAFARAQKSHKRVLLDLGANWCGDCIVLSNFLALPEMRRFIAAHYEVAEVDVGRFNRNLQIPARFGFTQRLVGVPTLLIATPDGKLLNHDDVFAVADARSMKPQAIADYFAKYAN